MFGWADFLGLFCGTNGFVLDLLLCIDNPSTSSSICRFYYDHIVTGWWFVCAVAMVIIAVITDGMENIGLGSAMIVSKYPLV